MDQVLYEDSRWDGPTIYLLGFAGALLFTVLLARDGVQDVIGAVAAAGWWLAVIPAFHLLPLFLAYV
jgi:hypothetical protein